MQWLLGGFQTPQWLLLLPLAPLLAWWVTRRDERRISTVRMSTASVLHKLPRGLAARLRRAPLLLRTTALALCVVGMARPQTFDPEELDVEGLDIVVALDMSGSMGSVDITDEDLQWLQRRGKDPVPRFDNAVGVLRRFIQSRRYDRIGMVVFGKQAYTEFPLTLDYGAVLGILRRLRMDEIDGGATVIGDALGKSLNLLRHSEARSKIVILITDGDNRGGHITPLQATDYAATLGVTVFPILVGTKDQSRLPSGRDLFTGRIIYKPTEFPINPELLQKIADKTGGSFYTAADREALEEKFQEILERFEKTRMRDLANALKSELFPWFVLPGFLLFSLAGVLELTAMRRIP